MATRGKTRQKSPRSKQLPESAGTDRSTQPHRDQIDPIALRTAFDRAPDWARFSARDLAPIVNRSIPWFDRSRWEGSGIPFVRDGRRVFYLKADVVAWLAAQPRHRSTSEYATRPPTEALAALGRGPAAKSTKAPSLTRREG